jgi:7-keto-8-aminopelargonate synthetase-like enzyme
VSRSSHPTPPPDANPQPGEDAFTPGPALRQVDRVFVRAGQRRLLYFGGCDYFRLASDPRIAKALRTGLAQHGLNVAASRITTGNHPLYAEAERAIAKFFGVERALLCPTGYVAGLTAIEGWRDQFTHALGDERAHPCLAAGARLANRPFIPFRHGNTAALSAALKRLPRDARPLVFTDGVFANDGFIPPLNLYLEGLPSQGWLLVDEAHAAGVLGRRGRGASELLGVEDPRLIRTCTFSKAFGVYGGAVLGRSEAIRAIAGRSHTFAGSTPLPLPLVTALLDSLRLVRSNRELRNRLTANTTWLKRTLADADLTVAPGLAPIISLTTTEPTAAALKARLVAAGIYPSFIRYPGGDAGGHFRFAISSEHTAEHLERLSRVLVAYGSDGKQEGVRKRAEGVSSNK